MFGKNYTNSSRIGPEDPNEFCWRWPVSQLASGSRSCPQIHPSYLGLGKDFTRALPKGRRLKPWCCECQFESHRAQIATKDQSAQEVGFPPIPERAPKISETEKLPVLWSWRAPNSTETPKELKWPKSDSKMTPRVPAQSALRWLKSDPKVTQKWGPESLLSQFWVTLGSVCPSHFRVTFGSL